jgi:predicted PurR-regulated permease PerM
MNLNTETTELKWIRNLLTIIVLPVIVIILRTYATIFIPLIFAVFISFIFAPMRAWLTKHKVPMTLNILLMMLVIVLVSVIFGGVVYAAVMGFIQQLPKYQARLTNQVQGIIHFVEQITAQMALAKIPNLDAHSLISGSGFSITGFLTGTMGTFMNVSSKVFLTMVFLMFIVGGSGKLNKRLSAVLTKADGTQALDTWQSIQVQIQRYFLNKSLVSLMSTTSSVIIMMIFRVDFIIIAAILYFAMSFIPNIGSIASNLFVFIVCLLQYGFGFYWGTMVVLLVCNELFFGNFVEPKIMSERLNITPIIVLISLIFWGYIWGIVGMMLAVPITSAINIVIMQINKKSIISAIISGS